MRNAQTSRLMSCARILNTMPLERKDSKYWQGFLQFLTYMLNKFPQCKDVSQIMQEIEKDRERIKRKKKQEPPKHPADSYAWATIRGFLRKNQKQETRGHRTHGQNQAKPLTGNCSKWMTVKVRPVSQQRKSSID